MVAKVVILAVGVALFVAIERLFALREQRVLRPGWRTDVAHFFLSHLLSQVGLVIGIGLTFGALSQLVSPAFQARVAAQPGWLQFIEALLVVDVASYFVHRAAHHVPILW